MKEIGGIYLDKDRIITYNFRNMSLFYINFVYFVNVENLKIIDYRNLVIESNYFRCKKFLGYDDYLNMVLKNINVVGEIKYKLNTLYEEYFFKHITEGHKLTYRFK